MSWSGAQGNDKLPARFTSSCAASSSCTLWQGDKDGVETVSSGTGDSVLTALFELVVDGRVSFLYKVLTLVYKLFYDGTLTPYIQLYSPNAGHFMFTIDGKEQLGLASGVNKLGYNHVDIALTKGPHVFTWVSCFMCNVV